VSYSVDTLERSARLVKAWGGAQLPNGQSLADVLTIGELSWWEVASPNLAAFYLPPYLAPTPRASALKRRLHPYGSWIKQQLSSIRPRARTHSGCDEWPSESVVLFLGFSQYMHRDVLRPVVERLKCRAVCLCDQDSMPMPLPAGDTWQRIWDHWDTDAAEQTRTTQASFQQALARLRAMRALPDVIRDGDQSLWRETRSLFDWLFLVYFPAMLPHAAVARHILERHCPALIVSADVDDKRNRVYCLLGRQLGIPSLEVQFGMCGVGNVEWRFFVADRLAVWGEQARDFMLSQNVPPNRMSVTGSPRHDGVITRGHVSDRKTMASLGVQANQVTVLLACTFSNLADRDKLAAVYKAIVRSAARCPNIVLIVKPHPGDPPKVARQFNRGAGGIIMADAREDIRALILDCDAFVTLGSTSTMDALLAGKPVIWPDLFHLRWWNDDFIKSGATLVARSEDELASCFRAVADGSVGAAQAALEPERQRFLERTIFRTDGQAAQRVAALADDMAQRTVVPEAGRT
jgi:hypothetical protein